jgi:type 1 fimbria pilin
MNSRKIFASLCAAIVMSPLASLHAAPAAYVKFSGSLSAATPCELNIGSPLVVDFQDLIIRNINGTSYGRKNVQLDILCDNNTNVKFEVTGLPSSFSNGALKTDVPALGIALEFAGAPLPLNSGVVATSSAATGRLEFFATPVLDPAVALSAVPAQAFSASAQILATYE